MLSGERVLLRGVERDDLRPLWEMYNDLAVEHRASDERPVPTSFAALEARFDKRAAEPENDKVRFVIELGGEVIGECSLHFFDDYARACHLGISIRRDKWGRAMGRTPSVPWSSTRSRT